MCHHQLPAMEGRWRWVAVGAAGAALLALLVLRRRKAAAPARREDLEDDKWAEVAPGDVPPPAAKVPHPCRSRLLEQQEGLAHMLALVACTSAPRCLHH